MERIGITPRQLQILKLRATGETSNRIAIRLGLSVYTINNAMSAMLHDLDVWTVTAALVLAIQMRWIDAGEIEVMRRDPIDKDGPPVV